MDLNKAIYTKCGLLFCGHTCILAPRTLLLSALPSIAARARQQSSTLSLASEMIKLRYSKKLFRRSSSKSSNASSSSSDGGDAGSSRGEIEWEVRPGGMLVQKRDGKGDVEVITVRVATGFSWHDVSIGATCTFGEYSYFLSVQKFFCYCSFARQSSHVCPTKSHLSGKVVSEIGRIRIPECVPGNLV